MRLFLKPKNDSHWHKLFQYEPSTGNLINRVSRGTRTKAGAIAGSCTRADGNIQIGISGKYYMAHRVVWEMVNGPIPSGAVIDHINGVRCDNRLSNLRLVTRQENQQRQLGVSGYVGVYPYKSTGKYQARICVLNRGISLGIFDTAEQAHKAYLAAASKLGYHENHGGEQHDEYR